MDVEINDYTIPQGAQIVINEWAIGRNPSIWENPNSFSPERFLGSEIDVKGRHFQLINTVWWRATNMPWFATSYKDVAFDVGIINQWL